MTARTQKQIQAAYRRLLARRLFLVKQIDALRAECSHPNRTEKAWGSTGNYDPHSDCYGYEYDCPDCGAHWIRSLE